MKLLNKFRQAGKSKDGKVLIENFTYLSLLQIAGYIFPLITLPYLAEVIGVDSFGKIAFASAIIGYFTTIADWGFNFTATRDVAKNRDNKEQISRIFSNVLWARCLLCILSFGVLIVMMLFIPQFKEISSLLIITFLTIPGHIMFPDWFFQAMEKMKYITILNLISKFLFTIAVFLFIKEKADYILQPLFISLGFILSGIIAMYYILVKWKIKLYPPKFDEVKKTIKGSTDVFINNLMPNLYNSFSIILLGFYWGSNSTGIYDASRKFTTVAHQFMYVISRTFFPFLSRKIEKHHLYARFYLTLASLASLMLFIFAPTLIKIFYTPEFYDAILILRVTSISIFLVALSTVYGTNFLIINKYEKELRNITIVCSIIGFGISIPLVCNLNSLGAALTLTLTQAILGISIMKKALKIKITK